MVSSFHQRLEAANFQCYVVSFKVIPESRFERSGALMADSIRTHTQKQPRKQFFVITMFQLPIVDCFVFRQITIASLLYNVHRCDKIPDKSSNAFINVQMFFLHGFMPSRILSSLVSTAYKVAKSELFSLIHSCSNLLVG